jgi:hypothetical protein
MGTVGEIRWEKPVRKIIRINLHLGQPSTYMVEGINTVAYTKNQLQQVCGKEQKPQKFIVESILKKEKRKRLIHDHFLLAWSNGSLRV